MFNPKRFVYEEPPAKTSRRDPIFGSHAYKQREDRALLRATIPLRQQSSSAAPLIWFAVALFSGLLVAMSFSVPSSTPKILSVLHTSTPNSVQSKIEDNVREDPPNTTPTLYNLAPAIRCYVDATIRDYVDGPVGEYVDAAILCTTRDPLMRADFALYVYGARVMKDLTTQLTSRDLRFPGDSSNHPEVALNDNLSIGMCWAIKQPAGEAPQHIVFWGVVDGKSNTLAVQKLIESNELPTQAHPGHSAPPISGGYNYIQLTHIKYDIYSDFTMQTFPIDPFIINSHIRAEKASFLLPPAQNMTKVKCNPLAGKEHKVLPPKTTNNKSRKTDRKSQPSPHEVVEEGPKPKRTKLIPPQSRPVGSSGRPQSIAGQPNPSVEDAEDEHKQWLKIKDWNTVAKKFKPLTKDKIDAYLADDDEIRCTPANVRVDFEHPWKRFSFNKEARAVFIENFISTIRGGGMAQNDPTPESMLNEKTVGGILDTYMDVCRRKYRKSRIALDLEQEVQNAAGEEKNKLLKKQQDLKDANDRAQRQAAKVSRRGTLCKSRHLVLLLCNMPQHLLLLNCMRPRHMSHDETNGPVEKYQAVYRIILAAWQSEELHQFLWMLDGLWREHWAKPDNQRRKAGNMPQKRVLHKDSKTEPGEAPIGLWRNCYDPQWIDTLRPYQRDRLEMMPSDYDFTIPSSLLS
ncbi:hypothetical protein ACG7TL_004946 [Trametes sanguinea]